MKKTKTSAVKKTFIGLVIAGVVGLVGYFDTYPTYFAKNVQIPVDQCAPVAALVAQEVLKSQGATPVPAVNEVAAQASRLSKRIAEYIIRHNKASLSGADAVQLFVFLESVCVASNGKATVD